MTHYFSHRSVAAVRLSAPLGLGDKIHIPGHTTDPVQAVASMEVEHARVDRAGPGTTLPARSTITSGIAT